MKHLLMISYPFPPNASAGAVRSERFARYLSRFSWTTDVVTIKKRKDLFVESACLDSLGENVRVHHTYIFDPWLTLREKKVKNIFLRILKKIVMGLSSFPDHMIFWVPFAVWKGLMINKETPINVIYTTSPPHSTQLAGIILSRLIQKAWVVDFRDPWTLNAHRRPGLFDSIEKFMEKYVLMKANLILANTKTNRDKLLKAFPKIPETKVVTLTNGWEEFSCPVVTSQDERTLTIVHAGHFYSSFKPYALLYAIAYWRDYKHSSTNFPLNRIKIILLGAEDTATAKVVNDLKLNNIVIRKPWVSLDKAREIMCHADILWASLGASSQASGYVPSKLFEYIAAKRLIWGFFPEGDAASLIRETNTGIVFTSDNPTHVINELERTINEKIERGRINYQPNEAVINKYKVCSIVRKLDELLSELTNNI